MLTQLLTLIYTRPCLEHSRGAQFSLFSSFSQKKQIFRLSGYKGGLAQLVERLLCKQNVNGSNPLTSTTRGLNIGDLKLIISIINQR